MAKAMDDRSGQVEAVIILFLVLTWVTFPLRAWVRLGIIKNWGVDDWLTLASLVSLDLTGLRPNISFPDGRNKLQGRY